MKCFFTRVIMDKELKEIVSFCLNDTLARVFLLVVIFLSFLTTVLLGLFSGFVVLGTYIAGFVTFRYAYRSRNEFGNLLSVLMSDDVMCVIPSMKDSGCNVCGEGSCERDRAAGKHIYPWTTLQIHPDLDKAIDDLLSKILKEYVATWYSEVSVDKAFEQELRHCIRYACITVLQRGLQVDLAQLILKRFIPAAVSHLDDYLSIREISQSRRITFLRAAVQHLGTRLHPATHSRERELEYLRSLTHCLIPILLSPSNLHCQNFSVLIRELLAGWVLLPIADALADPYILNNLFLILLGKHQLTQYPDEGEPRVSFLEKFTSSDPRVGSALHLDLASILKDQKLLYAFMQFLKGVGAINILQFCLDVEEFNRKMLTPELSPEETEILYRDAMDLYSVYFNQSSPDSIPLPTHIVDSMQQVLSEDVGKLRTSPPLFQAYEHAYSFLENKLCPLFHTSDDFYSWLCGPRLLSSASQSGNRPAKRTTDNATGTVARLSSRLHKIKGVLRGPIEGHTFDSEAGIDLTDSEFVEDLQLMAEAEDRDLSAWRVSIPNVESRLDQNNKPCSLFVIDVQRIDVPRDGSDDGDAHWTVERKYNDFYALEAKLAEFHGEFSDNLLPPKRSLFFSAPGLQFLESRKQVFEDYIQRLLARPSLRGSDLLYAFLRSPGEFCELNATPDGLSRLIRRTVPLTLRKEKGQHLEPFLQAFFASTESKKTSKMEYKDISVEPVITHETRKLSGTVFGDNLALTPESAPRPVPINEPHAPPAPPHNARTLRLTGLSNCLLHIAVCVYGISGRTLRMALSIRAVVGQTLDVVSRLLLSRALRRLLVAPRVAHLIKLLEGAIFTRRASLANAMTNAMELEERASRELDQFCASGRFKCWAAPALRGAFCAVQCPQLNKQLVYSLLDVIAEELFPELHSPEIHSNPSFRTIKSE